MNISTAVTFVKFVQIFTFFKIFYSKFNFAHIYMSPKLIWNTLIMSQWAWEVQKGYFKYKAHLVYKKELISKQTKTKRTNNKTDP